LLTIIFFSGCKVHTNASTSTAIGYIESTNRDDNHPQALSEFIRVLLAETTYIHDPSGEQLWMDFNETCQPADDNEQPSSPANG